MAREAIFMECYRRQCRNVDPAHEWVANTTESEQTIDAGEACRVVMEGYAYCRGPKLPGRSGDITTGICQLVYERTEIEQDNPEASLPAELPEPPEVHRHIEIRYGSF
jgi:hypothetical protein